MAIERAEAACRQGRGRILVFARAPYPGRVKRRLIPVYGKRGAARLYRLMLRDTLDTVTGLAPLELWCEPNTRHAFLRDCARQAGAELRVQRGRDLGERMYHAFDDALRSAPWALVVGSDCVSLSNADLDFACTALEQGRDAVTDGTGRLAAGGAAGGLELACGVEQCDGRQVAGHTLEGVGEGGGLLPVAGIDLGENAVGLVCLVAAETTQQPQVELRVVGHAAEAAGDVDVFQTTQ